MPKDIEQRKENLILNFQEMIDRIRSAKDIGTRVEFGILN